jgi:DNA-binding beta-propeller fold protein YncE
MNHHKLARFLGFAAAASLFVTLGCATDRNEHGEAGDGGAGDPDGDEGSDGSEGDGDGADGDDDRFDGGPGSDVPDNPGDCPGEGEEGEYDFSIIWIANSPEGTVSKIDTFTATEVARYRTGPGAPDPSRTSVNLEGDVAVANRGGSMTKIAARLDDCIDADGDGAIRTSSGPTDILPWGEDECILWHTPLEFTGGAGGPRAVAWDGGEDDGPCPGTGADVWIGWRNDPDDGQIRRLDGETGEPNAVVPVPGWQEVHGQGMYGGAVDKDGGFWVIGKGGTVLHVDPDTLEVRRWGHSPPAGFSETFYGMAMDAEGAPWAAGQSGHLYRFDPATESLETVGSLGSNFRGMAIDRDGIAWIAFGAQEGGPCGLLAYDTEVRVVVTADTGLDGCVEPVGVSIDAEQFVWVVDKRANRAYKVDPQQHTTQIVTGLVSPYTYSDMTGAGLDLVVNPPAG